MAGKNISKELGAVLAWARIVWPNHPTLCADIEQLQPPRGWSVLDPTSYSDAAGRWLAARYGGLPSISPNVTVGMLAHAFDNMVCGLSFDDPQTWVTCEEPLSDTAAIAAKVVRTRSFRPAAELPTDISPDDRTWEVLLYDMNKEKITHRMCASHELRHLLPNRAYMPPVLVAPNPEPVYRQVVWESVYRAYGGLDEDYGEITLTLGPGFDEEVAMRATRDAMRCLRDRFAASVGRGTHWRSDSYERHLRRYTEWHEWAQAEQARGRGPSEGRFIREALRRDGERVQRGEQILWSLNEASIRGSAGLLAQARDWLAPRDSGPFVYDPPWGLADGLAGTDPA